MKKIVLLVFLVLLLTGCTNINETSVNELVTEVQNSNLNLANIYHKGYKFYLPTDLTIKETDDFNEIIINNNTKYYMYVDIVSYFNKVSYDYQENADSYLSKKISYNEINGYLEVNEQNEKYLIEIMYNYAKIELIVDKDYLKEAITNSMIILSTIKYNDDIIKNMMGEDILQFNEEQLSIFKTKSGESNFLEYLQEYDTYESDDVPDLDLIN